MAELRIRRFLALITLGLLMAAGQAQAEARIALVVGNAAYANVTPLDNAATDAQLISGSLVAQGFEVTLLLDADQVSLTRAIAKFGRDLRDGGPETAGLFYYAGHGVQSFGVNYLLPVDASLTDAADLSLVAVPAESVLRQMNSAKNRTNIVILDACRNNPFEAIPDMDDNGLAEMKAPTGTFLAYSTAPGAVALDGIGGNSPFTSALAGLMPTPGLPIEQLFREVRVKVLEATQGAQTPWDTSSLTAEFFFAPPDVAAEAEAADAQLWEQVRATRDPVQVMLFIRGYPDSPFLAEAKAFLTEVMAQELNPEIAAAPAAPAPEAAPDPREAELIEVARTSGKAEDYEAYLAAFPAGTYAELAKFELSTLAAAAPEPAPEPVAVAPVPDAALAGMTFTTPFPSGEGITGMTLEELVKGSPLFPPIDGIPEAMWKGQLCSNCHEWTREALCDQAKTYLAESAERALAKPHPYGGVFKQGLKGWAAGGCP